MSDKLEKCPHCKGTGYKDETHPLLQDYIIINGRKVKKKNLFYREVIPLTPTEEEEAIRKHRENLEKGISEWGG